MWELRIRIFFIACLLTTLAAVYGCEGGGSGGGGQIRPTAKVSLFPTSGTINEGDIFTRTVEVEDVEEAFYVAFDLTYDPSVIEYMPDNVEEGTFLSGNKPDSTSLQAALLNGIQGRFAIGVTRLGQIGDVSGSGTLLTLYFKAVGPGNALLSFEDPKGIKNSANQDVVIDVWEGGTVTVQ